MKKKMEILMAVILLLTACLFAKKGAVLVAGRKADTKQGGTCIVIDAGHGGADPGKVGVNGAEEKVLNLQIALRLKKLLEAEGIEVVLTRTDDNGLYRENASNKKVEDMRRRCEIIAEAMPVSEVEKRIPGVRRLAVAFLPIDSSIFSYAPSRSSFCMGSDQDALVIAWSE